MPTATLVIYSTPLRSVMSSGCLWGLSSDAQDWGELEAMTWMDKALCLLEMLIHPERLLIIDA